MTFRLWTPTSQRVFRVQSRGPFSQTQMNYFRASFLGTEERSHMPSVGRLMGRSGAGTHFLFLFLSLLHRHSHHWHSNLCTGTPNTSSLTEAPPLLLERQRGVCFVWVCVCVLELEDLIKHCTVIKGVRYWLYIYNVNIRLCIKEHQMQEGLRKKDECKVWKCLQIKVLLTEKRFYLWQEAADSSFLYWCNNLSDFHTHE